MTNPLDPGYYCSEELRSFGFRAVGDNVRISGACNVVGPENIEIGDNVRIDAFTSIIARTGYVRLGSYIHIGTNCLLGARGGIEMGNFSGLSHHVKIFTASDDFSGHSMVSCEGVPDSLLNCTIERVKLFDHAIVCAGTTILPGAEIGEGAVVGAMSLVKTSLPAWGLYCGIPARRIAPRSAKIVGLAETLGKRVLAG